MPKRKETLTIEERVAKLEKKVDEIIKVLKTHGYVINA